MKLSDYIFNYLEKYGIKNVFTLAGGGCMHLLDSLGKSEKIQYIPLLHEQAVAIATESYAQTTGELGVALVTTGPGATNTVTGVLAAYLDSVPCLFISGQVKTADLKSNFGVRSHGSQEADIVEIVKSITKYAAMITDKNSVAYHLEKAIHLATTGRKGPVWLDIPLDIQGAEIDENSLEKFEKPETADVDFDVNIIVGKINKAKRPILILGNGVRSYSEKVYKLIEKLSIPVILSWKAMDLLPEDYPLYAGRVGGMGDRAGNLAMQNSDLLISLGSRLDFSMTGFDRKNWAVNAEKIIVDIDKTEIDKLGITVECPIVADVETVIDKLLLCNFENNFSNWLDKINIWKEKFPIFDNEKCYPNGKITTYGFMEVLCKNLKENAFVAPCSAGTTAEIFFQSFKVKKAQTIRSNHGLGSMGFELPNAIGMCIASRKKDVVCVGGDGGIQLNIQELAVVSGMKLPVKIFIISNNGYASIRNMQNNHFKGHYVGCDENSGLYLPKFENLANCYNLKYFKANSVDNVENTVKSALECPKPCICEVEVVGDCVVSPRTATMVMADGSMKSSPLENQFPFLDNVSELMCK
jgi:acetolactate synthase-1/2/3 large subunit